VSGVRNMVPSIKDGLLVMMQKPVSEQHRRGRRKANSRGLSGAP